MRMCTVCARATVSRRERLPGVAHHPSTASAAVPPCRALWLRHGRVGSCGGLGCLVGPGREAVPGLGAVAGLPGLAAMAGAVRARSCRKPQLWPAVGGGRGHGLRRHIHRTGDRGWRQGARRARMSRERSRVPRRRQRNAQAAARPPRAAGPRSGQPGPAPLRPRSARKTSSHLGNRAPIVKGGLTSCALGCRQRRLAARALGPA